MSTEVHQFMKDGKRVDPGAVQTARPVWVTIATTPSAGSEPLDIGVTARGPNGKATYQLVKALILAAANGDEKIQIFDIPRDWNSPRFRAIGITENGTYTTQIYAGTLGDGKRDADNSDGSKTFDCELAYVGQFAWVIGTQASIVADYEMADAVVVTESDWTVDMTTGNKVRSPGNNRVAEARFDLLGADLIVIIPTVASADSKLLARGF
jgi:hypothetical protein